MPQLIAGNWKMHGLAQQAVTLAQAIAAGAQGVAADLLVCPTALHVAAVAHALTGTRIAVGGQDCHQAKQGAHTGDIAAPMLRDAGATWVILGHSERRQNHGETDELVREKTLAAVEAGLTPDRLRRGNRRPARRWPGNRDGRLAARRQPAETVQRRRRL